MKPSLALWGVLGLGLGARSGQLYGQTTLEFDHARQQARLISIQGGVEKTRILRPGSKVILRGSDTVRVRVTNTNTAIYRFARQSQPVPAPGLDPLRSFLGTVKPFLPEVGLLIGGAPGTRGGAGATGLSRSILPPDLPFGTPTSVSRALAAGKRAERDVATIDDAIHGSGGLQQTHTRVLATLERMRTGEDVERAASQLREALQLSGDGCSTANRARRLPVTLTLLQAIEDLEPARAELRKAILDGYIELNGYAGFQGLTDSLGRIRTAADSAVGDYEPIVSTAYRVESLTLTAAYACSTWTGGTVSVKSDTGRSITLSIDARSEPELSRVADRSPVGYTVTFLPRWVVRPSLGASLLVAPNATFPRFGARSPATGGGTEVYESGTQDARFNWGITLGFTWRGMSLGSDEKPGVALWLPELTVNPGSDSKSLSAGVGMSFRFLKLGVGMSWIRHSELVDLRVGQTIPNKDFLRVRDTFRSPKLYVSLSVFDWPPFMAK